MRLEQLYIFQKIAESGSIRKASESLYSSPQNISKSMIQLEKEWNTTLYTRSKTGIQLTEDGEQAYLLIQNILKDIEVLNQYFHVETPALYCSETQALVSVCSCSVMEPIATATINIILSENSEAPIQIDKKSSSEIRKDLYTLEKEDDMPDLVLLNEVPEKMTFLQKKTEKIYHCYFIFSDELCLQVPLGDPLAQYDKIPLKLLETLPMLLYTGTPKQKAVGEKIIQELGHEMKNVSRTSNIETCSRIALNQHKYCFVGYPSVEFRPMANVAYVPLEVSIHADQLLLVKKRRRNRTFTNAFIKSMDDCFNLKKLW
ncbi:MAG: LysR family transcriptional regulator [Eubacteriales bacterium]|nr:LysR family transcriptional regulator [Eubacteriales bacterium]